MKTYVYEETEVKLTGRTAVKELESPKPRRGSERTARRVETLIEIMPVEGGLTPWKKWVKKTDLFEILQETKLEQD